MPDLTPGSPVHLDFRKWDDAEHWQRDTIWLGSDEHGDWVGARGGSVMHRPGVEVVAEVDDVMLFPAAGWAAAFSDVADADRIQVYVDITTEPVWFSERPARVRLIDLDLDVVRRGETTYIDDEDEFAEHQVRYGYPVDLIRRCAQTAADVLQHVTDRTGPFAPEVAQHWLSVLREQTSDPPG